MKVNYILHDNWEVQYWMNRAIKAEEKLLEERESQIQQHPELWESYTQSKGLLQRIFS